MTITVTIPEEFAGRLQARAERQHKSLEEIVVDLITQQLMREEATKARAEREQQIEKTTN